MPEVRSGYKHWRNLGQADEVCFQAPTDWRYSSARAYEQPEGQDEVDLFESLTVTRRTR